MALGNDVVDLDDPETRLASLHPRYAERAFSAGEQSALAGAAARHVLHWVLWAAKESAYKALKRAEPGLVFSPREFEVRCPAVAAARRAHVKGRVFHRDRVLELEVRVDDACVHAIARSRDAAALPLLARVEPTGEDPSASVRRLAAAALATRLAVPAGALRIEGRPPVAWHDGRALDAVVSLSHHGRFVAFACALRG